MATRNPFDAVNSNMKKMQKASQRLDNHLTAAAAMVAKPPVEQKVLYGAYDDRGIFLCAAEEPTGLKHHRRVIWKKFLEDCPQQP